MASEFEWTAPPPPRTSTSPVVETRVQIERLSTAEGIAFGLALAAAAGALVFGVAMLPLDTLRTSLDGSGLREDAMASGLVGVALVIGGVYALNARRDDAEIRMGSTMAFSIALSVVLTMLLASAARTLSRSPVIDGVAVRADAGTGAPWIATLALLVFVAVLAGSRERKEALQLGSAALLLSVGATAALVAAWVLSSATRLVVAAEARSHDVTRRTPLSWALVVLALVVATALFRRRR